jgi:hypothetical protein
VRVVWSCAVRIGSHPVSQFGRDIWIERLLQSLGDSGVGQKAVQDDGGQYLDQVLACRSVDGVDGMRSPSKSRSPK